jgi:putative transcriptional regulator
VVRVAAWLLLALLAGVCGARADDDPEAIAPVFLVSRAEIGDPNFADTVILLLRRGPSGAMGVIVNRPTRVTLAEALPEEPSLKSRDDPVFLGGPVGHELLLFACRSTVPVPGGRRLFEGVYLGAGTQALHDFLARSPRGDLRVFVGAAGWAPGQLEEEIEEGDWRLLPADPRSLLDVRPRALWRELDRRASGTMASASR